MINDYHALRIGKALDALPDDMVHAIANDVELTLLERNVKPEEIAMLYESIYRQRPKVHGVTVTDTANIKEQVRS